jgi:iron(II)-dependent oxidoreductase
MNTRRLTEWVLDARQRTRELMEDLSDAELTVPRLPIVNPLLWEFGHIAWFQEKWVLRHGGRLPSLRQGADGLYDSATVLPDTRWDLPLPGRAETLGYLLEVRDRVLDRLQEREGNAEIDYFTRLAVFHEDMHTEAFTYMRQTLGYRAPRLHVAGVPIPKSAHGSWRGDVAIPGGEFLLGATPDEPFVFDNEKWAHPVRVEPFAMARAPVTQAEFASFVDEGGYHVQRFWSEEGWRWRAEAGAGAPLYWERQAGDAWLRRHFDRWVPLEPDRPMVHVSWHEAEAYCRWAGRRLPTEVEWEVAAAAEPGPSRQQLALGKRRFPWGDSPPGPQQANLDWAAMGCVDVAALAEGDSAFGCRQMIGNVWEWTASDFGPYPGFMVDPYKEYSEPWFGMRKVLRGGCWATRARLLRNTWRNFFRPERRDVFAGFRTCALAPLAA